MGTPPKISLYDVRVWLRRNVPRDTTLWRALKAGQRVVERLQPLNVYRALTKSGIFVREDELWMASLLPQRKLDLMLELYRPRSVLDLGCGVGRTLDYLMDRGVDAVGVEGSRLAIARARRAERIVRFDLARSYLAPRRFDVLWCFELVEHVHPRYVDNLMKTLTTNAPVVVMSAAQPGQGGAGHFNEQLPEYWIERFARRSFTLHEEHTRRFRSLPEEHSENMLVFHHPDAARAL